jgi:hypothetical protein
LLEHLADALHIHESVTDRAKLEFAKYRDIREAVQQFEEVVAACLVIAYEELSLLQSVDKQVWQADMDLRVLPLRFLWVQLGERVSRSSFEPSNSQPDLADANTYLRCGELPGGRSDGQVDYRADGDLATCRLRKE